MNNHTNNQCPICLKYLSSASYLQKHIFHNKRKCTAPIGHKPPKIDYEHKQIIWDECAEPSNKSAQGVKPKSTSNPTNKSSISEPPSEPTPKPIITDCHNETPSGLNQTVNKYRITVDNQGNMIDLPNVATDNVIIGNNPALFDQIKQIVQKLNIPSQEVIKMTPDVEKCQRLIERTIEEFGDTRTILAMGLCSDIKQIKNIVNTIYDPDVDTLEIETVPLPDEFYHIHDRPTSIMEIIFLGMYELFSKLSQQKFKFFDLTHAKKAYMDYCKIMKYRKIALTSYITIKYRLDKMMNKSSSNNEKYHQLIQKYSESLMITHFSHIHSYDPQLLNKLKLCQLSSVEFLSFLNFFDSFSELFTITDFNRFDNPTTRLLQEDATELAFKRTPNYKYLDLDKIPSNNKLFPDFNYDIIEQTYCSRLVKIKTSVSNRLPSSLPDYYKRIYIDGTCEPPVTEQTYNEIKDMY